MKSQLRFATCIVALLSTINSPLSTAYAQGSLTPPGAPAPGMKTLAQIEPRTAITNSGAVTLSSPGSYYLTTNITVSSGDAITIATNGVTLDLNGFTIRSTAASAAGNAILLNSGLRNITIANGFIQGGVTNNGSGTYSGSGFACGILYSSTAPVNVLVSHVSVVGCLNHGICLSATGSTVVDSCLVRTMGLYGIYADTIRDSTAVDCGSIAINGKQVSNCRGECTGSLYGIDAATALNCSGSSSTGTGLRAFSAQNCYGSSISGYGIYAGTIENCYGTSTSGTGTYATTPQGNDPRTAITAAPFTINLPGSYYLAGNLTVSSGNAITIATNGVTLDLSGFTIRSTAASAAGTAILLNSDLCDITVSNGHIRGGVTNNGSGTFSGTGFGYGIYYSGYPPMNVFVSRISVSGCLYSGISLAQSSTVESCTVRAVGNYGIGASIIRQSVAVDCSLNAINGDQVFDCWGGSVHDNGVYASTALNCCGYSEGSGYGVHAYTAQNCYGRSSSSSGVNAFTAQNCYGYSSSSYGLYAYHTATGCCGASDSGTGLFAHNAAFCTGYRAGGTAIEATVATGCYAESGTYNITYKFNMP
jgi:hypothetical protein